MGSYSDSGLLQILVKSNMTFDDLKETLKHEDEVTIIELLDLTSEDLVEILESFIEDKQDKLRNYYGEDSEDVGREEISN